MQAYVPDHYRVLGVSTRADGAALKDSYRKLSRVYHPDRQAGSRLATRRFQLISSAYATLSDVEQREKYDRLLLLTDPLRFVEDPRADRALDVLDGVVRRLRGRPKELPARRRGRNLRVRHELSFARATLGGRVAVQVTYRVRCGSCAGRGMVEPERNPVCHVCTGKGRLKVGVRRQWRECSFCEGRGHVVLAPCKTCEGSGEVELRRTVQVDVPSRCREGVTLRVRGAGEPAEQGADRGDLLVDIRVRPDPLFSVQGDDVVVKVPLSFAEAALGASIEVPTLEGVERLRVPSGSPSGRELRVEGMGMPTRRGRGDLRYRLEIDVPELVDSETARRIGELSEAIGVEHLPRRRAFVEQVARRAEL